MECSSTLKGPNGSREAGAKAVRPACTSHRELVALSSFMDSCVKCCVTSVLITTLCGLKTDIIESESVNSL